VQSLWIGEVGLLERLSMASFVANGHAYHLYSYDEPAHLPAGVELRDAAQILPRERIFRYASGKEKGGYSGFADVFRYKLLRDKGGWWADTDVICLKPFTHSGPLLLGSERKRLWGRKICIGVMAAPAGHALMQRCFEAANANDPATLRFAGNGEPIVRRLVAELGLESAIAPPEWFNPVNWWQSASIGVPGSAALLKNMHYALHCYGESWRWRLQDREATGLRGAVFGEDTLLGALQRRYLPELRHAAA